MAERPQFQRETFFSPSPVDTSAARAAQGLAQAFGAVGQISSALGERAGLAREAAEDAQVSSAAADIEVQIDYASKQFADDTEGFNNYVNSSVMGTVKSMPKKLKGRTISSVNKVHQMALNSVVVADNEKQMDNLRVESNAGLDVVSTNAANLARDLSVDGVQEQRNLFIEGTNNALYDSEVQAEKLKAFDAEMLSQQTIGLSIRTADNEGLVAAFSQIQTLRENGVDGIEPDILEKNLNEAESILKGRVALKEKNDAKSDKATKNAQDVNYNNLFARSVGAADTEETQIEIYNDAKSQLANNRIRPDQFNKLITEIDLPDGIDSITHIEDINIMIADMKDAETINDSIRAARVGGFVTAQTATALYGKNASRRKNTVFSRHEKQARENLKLILTGSSVDLVNLGNETATRYSNALNELNDRLETAEQDNIDPRDIVSDILSRFGTGEVDVGTLPRPIYHSGTDYTVDSLKESKTVMLKEFRAGRIDKSTADREIKNYNLLITVKTQKEAAAAALANSKKGPK